MPPEQACVQHTSPLPSAQQAPPPTPPTRSTALPRFCHEEELGRHTTSSLQLPCMLGIRRKREAGGEGVGGVSKGETTGR